MPEPSSRPPGYRTQADDTDYEIEQLLIERWRAMSVAQKAASVAHACRALDALAVAGIKLRHPDAGMHERRMRLAALKWGPALAREVLGWDPDREGY